MRLLAARGLTSNNASGAEDQGSARFIPEVIHEDQSTERPVFSEPLAETMVIEEGEPLRLQASLQPANDPLMKVRILVYILPYQISIDRRTMIFVQEK